MSSKSWDNDTHNCTYLTNGETRVLNHTDESNYINSIHTVSYFVAGPFPSSSGSEIPPRNHMPSDKERKHQKLIKRDFRKRTPFEHEPLPTNYLRLKKRSEHKLSPCGSARTVFIPYRFHHEQITSNWRHVTGRHLARSSYCFKSM